jgi:DsbC/DsbD-like thiol-disulfide interchange protein
VKNRFSAAGLVALLLLLNAGSINAVQGPPLNPITWILKDSGSRSPLAPGASFPLQIFARITPGWHLYSTSQPEGGPIPTRIWLPEGQSFQMVRDLKFPVPHKMFDKNFEMEVEYYQELPTFVLSLKVNPKTPAGKHPLVVNARFQACNDRVCLPPRTEKISLDLEVAAGK